jgi:carbamoyl-phosphate synthase large subunit
VPFVSKATGVPIARLAARVMAGESLAALDATEQIPDAYSVKEVVLPFDRLPDADPRLGPEMKSTGEVMGTHETFGRAYDKAQIAAGAAAPTDGTAVIEIDDDDLRERFGERFEIHEPADTPAAIREGAVDYLVSDRRASLRAAVDEDVPYVSTVAAAEAVLTGLDSRDADLSTVAVTDRSRRQERWGGRGE